MKILNIFKKKQNTPQSGDGEKEFSFIWNNKIKNGNETYYTKQFRIKINERNKKEAIEKLTIFAERKMELFITEEKNWSEIDLSKIQDAFDKVNNTHQDAINTLHI